MLRTFALVVTVTAERGVVTTADLSGATIPQAFPLLDCIGASHGEMWLWEVSRNHLRAVQRDIGFKHIRGHGLLNDDMSTYLNGRANLFPLFDVVDFLSSIRMRPIFELSFTPSELASSDASWGHYRANISPPKDLDAWGRFMHDLVAGLVARYGIDEIRSWRFELYNEPNCGFFSGSQAQYFAMYNATARYIKSVDALIPVGGPATCQTGWIPEFLAYANGVGAPVDHVTTHLYPTDPGVQKNRDGFSARVREAAANVTRLAKNNRTPLIMTEFNAGLGLPSAVNGDTAHSASFLIHNHIALQGLAALETLSYWCFSDVFEEGGCDSTPWHNGYGIQNIYGVPKPVYRAFEMLAALPASALPVSVPPGTIDAVVTAELGGSLIKITAVLTNYDLYTSPPPTQDVQVVFSNVPAGAVLPAYATLELIDSTHANAVAAWRTNGAPQYPNASEIAAELAASQLVAVDVPLTAAAGSASVSITLEAYAVARVRFAFFFQADA